jgi:NAD-dependent dihydropyrimidine dehydrogenase PreA subunit
MSDSDVMIYIDSGRCQGCGQCVEACPVSALRLEEGIAQIDQTRCTGCEACLAVCPEKAILSVRASGSREEALAVIEPTGPPARSAQPSQLTRWAPKIAPILGAALAYVAHEVVPQVMAHWLSDADRRTPVSPEISQDGEVSPDVSDRRRAGHGRLRHRGGR